MSDARVAVYRDQPLVADDTFTHLRYVVKRPLLQLWDRRHDVYTPDGRLAMRSHSPVLKLRDEITLFADAAKTRPLLRLKQKKIIQLSTEWHVHDAVTGEDMGTLKKQFTVSLVQDRWDILAPDGTPRGMIIERGNSLLRRFVPFLTSHHEIVLGDRVVAHIRQKFRFFSKEFHLDLSPALGAIDTRFVIGCTLLVLAAEANRESGNGFGISLDF
jgi:uncharacterized protein YxjI